MPAAAVGLPGWRGPDVRAGRRRKVGSVGEFGGKGAAEGCCGERGDGRGDGTLIVAESCDATRFGNGERAYGPGGAAGSLKIGFGRGRVGDGDADGLGLLADCDTAAALGDGDR